MCLRGNTIAPLRHAFLASLGTCAKGVQFYCPSRTYPAISYWWYCKLPSINWYVGLRPNLRFGIFFLKKLFFISVRTLVWFVFRQVMVQFIYLQPRIRLKIKCHRWYPQLLIFLAQLPTNFYPNISLPNGVSVKSRFPVVPDVFVLLVPTIIQFWQVLIRLSF